MVILSEYNLNETTEIATVTSLEDGSFQFSLDKNDERYSPWDDNTGTDLVFRILYPAESEQKIISFTIHQNEIESNAPRI